MDNSYLHIANDPFLWVICIPLILVVALQAFLFTQRAMKAAPIVGLEKQQTRQAFRVGATSAIGPSLSVFVVMVAMMGVIGGPITWWRLSMIGAANTELTASQLGAQAMGVEFGSAAYGVTEFANSVWAMALNGCGWLVFCGLFTDKLEGIQEKVAGGDAELMQKICGAAVLGTASFLVALNAQTPDGGIAPDKLTASIIAAFAMIVLSFIGNRYPKLKEYSLGLSMILGMLVGVLVFNHFGGI